MDIVTINEYDATELTRKLRVVGTEFADLLKEAFERGAHVALGYRTFAAYMVAEVPAYIPAKLDRASRNALIRDLRAAGMSTRDAAKVTGVDQKTASNASRSEENSSPAKEQPQEPTRTTYEDEASTAGAVPATGSRFSKATIRLVDRLMVEAGEHCNQDSVSQDTTDLIWRVIDNLSALAYDTEVPRNEAFQALDAFTNLLRHIK